MSSSHSRVSRPIFTKLGMNAMLWQKTLHQRGLTFKFRTVLHYSYASKCNLLPWEQDGLPCSDFHETQECPTALRPELLHRISLQSDNKCGKYLQNYIYAFKYSVAFNAPLFTKLIITQHILMDIIVPNFIQIVRNCSTPWPIFIYALQYSMAFTPCTDFHETCNCSVELCGYLLYRISPKWISGYEK